MAEQLMGVDYFPVETDMKDDDKVFALKYRFGLKEDGAYDNDASFAAYGRFIELLAAIYHDGFAMRLTDQKRLQLAQRLGMALPEFGSFVQSCVDVGLFDDGLWAREGVLTSRGIQHRYFHAVKRRKGGIPAEFKAFILTADCERDADADGTASGCDANTVQTSCEHDANTHGATSDDIANDEDAANGCDANNVSATKAHIKEKKRKEKDIKEEDRKPRARRASSSSSSSMNLLSDYLGDVLETGQPSYPLQCFSTAPTDGRVFNDSEGNTHQTPWDALCARYSAATGGQSIGDYAREVAKLCPDGCRCSSSQVSQCFALLCSSLDKFDPSKCANPLPLTMTILKDRVIEDA